MEWFSQVQRQAQQAAEKFISSEAADRARQLAQQATQQAAAFAQQASVKAQEVAKEALGEAEKSLTALRQQGGGVESQEATDPLQYGISPELERFVCSLTYSTFSDYPLDSLDVPTKPDEQKLSKWQETHARLMLQRVQQLQDLRFVLCPRRMEEYMFWLIYFTLCRRYLPQQQDEPVEPSDPSGLEPAAAAATGFAAAGTAATLHGSSGGKADAVLNTAAQGQPPAMLSGVSPASQPAPAAASSGVDNLGAAAGSPEPPPPGGAGEGEAGPSSTGVLDDDLAQLADDPELNAYLEDALQLESKGGDAEGGDLGSDMEDLDDYINQLDAEVNASS